MSKGSRNRTTNWKAFRENMDRIVENEKRRKSKEPYREVVKVCGHDIEIIESAALKEDEFVILQMGKEPCGS